MRDVLEQAVALGKTHTHEGAVATYIPELEGRCSQLGVSVFAGTANGFPSGIRKSDSVFRVSPKSSPLQSRWKSAASTRYLKSRHGPTGDPFNSLMKLENTDSSPTTR